jgi:hypothetical protein
MLPTKPTNRGNRVRNNFFKDVPTNGVYCDNYTMGVWIEQNYFQNVGYVEGEWGYGAVMLNCGGQNQVHDNVFVDCLIPVVLGGGAFNNMYKKKPEIQESWNEHVAMHGGNRIEGTLYAKYPTYREFVNLSSENDFDLFKFPRNYATRNLIANPKVSLTVQQRGGKKAGYGDKRNRLMVENDYVTSKDPGFEDYKNGNFALKKSSRVWKEIKDFNPGDFTVIGAKRH